MKKHFWLIVIIALGLVLRFYHNNLISLWHDEAFSALMIRYSWGEMFYRLGLDVHPPAYYAALRLWHYLFGDSLLALRGMSIFFGAASIWAAWAFVKESFKDERAALWAALLVAINPFQLQYVTEARMYTMGAFFGLLAAYFLVKALNLQKQLHDSRELHIPHLPESIRHARCMWLAYLGFTLSIIIIIYTHYYLFFTAAAIGLYGILFLFFHHKWDWKKYVPLLFSFIVIAFSYLPWLKTFLFQYRQVQEGYWIPKMTVWSMPATLWDMLLGFARDTSKPLTKLLLTATALLTLYIFYRFVRKTDAFHKWLVILCVAAPFGGALLFALLARLKGSDSSVYMDRYFLFASIFYSIAVGDWLKKINSRWLAACLLAVYCALNIFAFANFWNRLDVKTKPGMSGAARYILSNFEPGQKLYAGSSFMFFNLKYYALTPSETKISTPATPLLFSGGVDKAKNISHYAGSALLSDADLLPDFSASTKPGDTVWLVWTNGFGSSKPEVPKTWTQLTEKGFAEVRPWVGTWVVVTQYKVN